MLRAVLSAEELRELPVDPLWIGIGTLGLFIALMVGLLSFGKGRPHT